MLFLVYYFGMKKFIGAIRWIPAVFILSCSWYLSSQSVIENMPSFWNADKLVHGVCFGGLAFWVCFAFIQFKKNSKARFIASVIFVSVYGIIDEIHQSFTPGRETSFFDWMADTLGAVFGCLVFFLVCRLLEKIRPEN